MPSARPRSLRIAFAVQVFGLCTTLGTSAQDAAGPTCQPSPQGPSAGADSVRSLEQLAAMTPQQLDWLYANAPAGVIPSGRTRGRLIVDPGSRLPGLTRLGSRAVWQGKVFQPCNGTAINRFFGVRIIRAQVGYGPSWRDGRDTIVLDYSQTSLLYEPYRDEIRQVGPGLYLGLMYERTAPQPSLKLYFALADPAQGAD